MVCKILSAVVSLTVALGAVADDGTKHLAEFSNGRSDDQALIDAAQLKVKVPVMCREWHVWWSSPVPKTSLSPMWRHWDGQKLSGKYSSETTLEQLRPGSSWRRWLNSRGYPLLGPYDPSQEGIIRWQLQTARNAGLECLHVQLWPTIQDSGSDMQPLPTWEKILDIAAELNYPVAVHDEIQFRGPPQSGAQKLENSIRRTVQFIQRYAHHPGFYKIDGMPYFYFQNHNNWLSADDLAKYVAEVEKKVGPVYWVVEMGLNEKVYAIPQIKSFITTRILHEAPPYQWEKLQENIRRNVELAHRYNKKIGALVFSRFDNSFDRGPSVTPAEDGRFMLSGISTAIKGGVDYVVLTQWNDFEEGAYIEPAWDFDGFNDDPYRYCRMVAAMTGKKFTPAPLPPREQTDLYIRHKLYGDSAPGDLGPVALNRQIDGNTLIIDWAKDTVLPGEVRLLQNNLAVWKCDQPEYRREALRLANWGDSQAGELRDNAELRFYVPGLAGKKTATIWLAVQAVVPDGTRLVAAFAGNQENTYLDSRWRRRETVLERGYKYPGPEQTKYFWIPLYNAGFAGYEGDLTLRLEGSKAPSRVVSVWLWSSEMIENSTRECRNIPLDGIDRNRPFVAVGYDSLGNAGQPLFIPAKTTKQ